jgi:YaiO family outer membrane protein
MAAVLVFGVVASSAQADNAVAQQPLISAAPVAAPPPAAKPVVQAAPAPAIALPPASAIAMPPVPIVAPKAMRKPPVKKKAVRHVHTKLAPPVVAQQPWHDNTTHALPGPMRPVPAPALAPVLPRPDLHVNKAPAWAPASRSSDVMIDQVPVRRAPTASPAALSAGQALPVVAPAPSPVPVVPLVAPIPAPQAVAATAPKWRDNPAHMLAAPETPMTIVTAPPVAQAKPAAMPGPPATAALGQPAMAGAPPAAMVPVQAQGVVEAGGDYHVLTHHNGDWAGEYAKGEIQTDPNNRWNAEVLNQREFGDHGVYGAIGNTHNFDEDWYSNITVGSSTGGFFLPRYRIDAFLNRKLLEDRSLIATFGLGEYRARDGHEDRSGYIGATYYLPGVPYILEGGLRLNHSDPGGVWTTYQHISFTEGTYRHHFITLRFGFGYEGYENISQFATITNFPSEEVSLTWRQWLEDDWGFNIRGEAYHNPYYSRFGVTSGVFKEF